MNLSNIIGSLKLDLENLLDHRFDHISFGILPDEDPKGFMQLDSVSPQGKQRKDVSILIGILYSSDTINGLNSQIYSDIEIILDRYQGNQSVCLGNDASDVRLGSTIEVSMPQTYANRGRISDTDGFFTSVAFNLVITVVG